MANYTTNYNLKKPLGSENYNVSDQNGNMDIIDAAMKANADAIAKDEEGIANRLGNTNTTGATLAVGTFVYVTGNTNGVSDGMYKVTTAIAANGSLTTSNLGSVPGGIGNALNSKFTPSGYTVPTELASGTTIIEGGYVKVGNMVVVNCRFNVGTALVSGQTVARFPSAGLNNSHVSAVNNKKIDCGIDQYGYLAIGESLTTGTFIVSTTYFCV